MNKIEKCFEIIDHELKCLTTKDQFGQLPLTISDEFDEFSYEGKSALDIILNYNLIYFRGTDESNLHIRIAEITDEGVEALSVGVKNYLTIPERKKIGFIQ